MMFREVQNALIFGNLHVQWCALFEAALPIDGEAQEADVKFFRFLFVKDSEDRRGLSETHLDIFPSKNPDSVFKSLNPVASSFFLRGP